MDTKMYQLGNMTGRNGWGVGNAQYNYAPQFVNNKMTVNPVTGATVQMRRRPT
jgi:hypothetical protein